MTEKERFTVDSDGNYWDKINHRYVNLDYLFRLVDELDTKLDNKQHTINEMAKTIRIYDDGYIDLNKKYKKVVDENEQLKQQNEQAIDLILNGIMEMHDGKRDYAETLFNKAIKVIKNDT